MLRLDALSGRLEPLLVARVEGLALAVEQGDESAWSMLCESLVALEALSRVASPERRGGLLTVSELAARLGVRAKSARRMVADGRLRPAVHEGRFLRFRGDERPLGRAAPRPLKRASGPVVATHVATVAVSGRGQRRGIRPPGAVTRASDSPTGAR